MQNLKAIQWKFKDLEKKEHLLCEIGIGGQCCYESGPSALLTIKTHNMEIEIQLNESQCKVLAEKLNTCGVDWAKSESFNYEIV